MIRIRPKGNALNAGASPIRIEFAVQWLGIGLIMVLCGGCASSPFAKNIRAVADQQPDFATLRNDVAMWKNRMVILGGEIIETSNQPRQTVLEVLQKPLDSSQRPMETDKSAGRFLIRCDRFLDPALYSEGRDISIAGTVLGDEVRSVGQVEYKYPVIGCQELHLWPRQEYANRYYAPPAYWYGPGWGYMPYGYPYW